MISKLEKRIVAFFVACVVILAELPCTILTAQAADRADTREIVQDVLAEDEIAAGETIAYSFTPDATATYTITTVGESDTVGNVYDADWNLLYSDNDSGEGLNYQIEANLTEGATYYVETGFFVEGETGVVATSVTEKLAEASDVVETEETAAVETEDATQSDALEEAGETVAEENENYEYVVENGTVRITKYIGSATDVVIPEQIEGKNVTSIGRLAFAEEYGAARKITSVLIPSKVTELQYGVFCGCRSLNKITFSNSGNLKTIGDSAFERVGSQSIELPNGVETLGSCVFFCADVEKVKLPNTVTSMGNSCFKTCQSLKDVTLSSSLKKIPDNAFENTISLENIKLPDSITEISGGAFAYSGLRTLTLPAHIESIGEWAFSNTKITSVTFPNSLTYLGGSAFYRCKDLKTVKFGTGLNAVFWGTFEQTGIKNLDLGNVQVIYKEAFINSDLETLNIPSSVTDVQYWSFSSNKNLTSITVSPNLMRLENGAFSDTKWYANQPEGVTYIGHIAYGYKGTASGTVSIKEGTTSIAARAFLGQQEITSVKLPESLKYINKYAFACDKLKEIEIPDSVETIDRYAVGYMIGKSYETIDDYLGSSSSFYEYENFESIEGFTIIGYPGSEAERYAKDNGFTFKVKETPDVSVSYQTHVQSIGWQDPVKNGTMSGTSGKAKRLEGIRISVSGNKRLGIQYSTHCQTYGWLPWSANGEMNGTTGEAKRLEAIKIQLTGKDKDKYDVYYRVHAQSYGWLGWAKNGAPSGTAGYAKRLEGIQIVVVKKGAQAPGLDYAGVNASKGVKDARAYIAKTNGAITIPGSADNVNVMYKTHVQSFGWQNWVLNGTMSGTSGKAKRLEGINIKLSNAPYAGGIQYKTHIQSFGWEKQWKKDGEMSGTSGKAKRLEAIQIQLYGEMSKHYDVYYRVHAQSYGWLNWAKNGEEAGTAGLAKRLEGIQIVLVPKGSAAPSANYGNIKSVNAKAYIKK